ncbi:hypothetical protein [Rhodopseudomonas sp. B29]|uniref:hypothetical protein n=1 Tax=Rhodopseudomonas sp. B29 TaxID=95607 RepID=UPI0011D21A02|nr:hypothetical protein [Rhodopseudomonas sp. B29]
MPGAGNSNIAPESIVQNSEGASRDATERRPEALILDLKSKVLRIENERRLKELLEQNKKLAAFARETAEEIFILRSALMNAR